MNINCTYDCKYQKNGKCSLIELTNIEHQVYNGIDNYTDCAYYEKVS